jgi:uncharacterized integral membrane protein (TIGR00697 family)
MALYIVIANVVSTKLIILYNLIVSGGVVIYSLTFLITDIISERFSKKEAKKALIGLFTLNL